MRDIRHQRLISRSTISPRRRLAAGPELRALCTSPACSTIPYRALIPALLVKLYELADDPGALARLAARDIVLRAVTATEGDAVARWVTTHFSDGWGRAAEVASLRQPSGCVVAVERDLRHVPAHGYDLTAESLLGFACYDADVRGMFGPTRVRPDRQGAGVGTALLRRALRAMADADYAYAVIGWAGPVAWYAREVGAVAIPGSEPGPYHGPLHAE